MPPCESIDESCLDSTSWFYKKSPAKTCRLWVAEDPDDRCKKKDSTKIKARDACPSSCGECLACVDSTSWVFKKKSKQTCDYVSKKRSSRCKSKNTDDDGVSALDACLATCGQCEVGDASRR